MKPKLVISADIALPWVQKRTFLIQKCINRLLNPKKELNCGKKQAILSDFMQALNNSGYTSQLRKENQNAGLKKYNKILEADQKGGRPIFWKKEWRRAARWIGGQKRKKSWLVEYKSCIFIPPTTNSNLKKALQAKEKEMRVGGREKFPIKIIETAGKSLERVLVSIDPFERNQCIDKTCFPNKHTKNKIGCR